MSKAAIVIPARYGSSRLSSRPLLGTVGEPMIQHVYERASQAVGVAEVWVATDDPRVEQVVQTFGGKVIMTRSDHESGTDRLVGVVHKVEADTCINLQGNEPMIRPRGVRTLLQGMHDDPALPVTTLCHVISAAEAAGPSTAKVVVNVRRDAFYFSRSPIPYPHNAEKVCYLKHVGIYVYHRDVLRNYSQLPEPIPGQAKSLEQLRLMNAGINIRAFEVAAIGPGVDTPACLEKVRTPMARESVGNA